MFASFQQNARTFLSETSGATSIEYAVMASIFAIFALVGFDQIAAGVHNTHAHNAQAISRQLN